MCVCVEGSRSGMWSGVGQRCVSVIWSVSAVMRSFLLTWCCCTRLILMECVTLRRPTWMEKPTSNKGRWSVTCHSRWVASLSISLSSSSLLSFFSLHIFMRWNRFCQKESVFFVLKSIKLFKRNKMQFISTMTLVYIIYDSVFQNFLILNDAWWRSRDWNVLWIASNSSVRNSFIFVGLFAFLFNYAPNFMIYLELWWYFTYILNLWIKINVLVRHFSSLRRKMSHEMLKFFTLLNDFS